MPNINDGCLSRLALLRTVEAAGLLADLHAERVERTADDVIANTRKIANTAAADEHDRVLLQVVAFTRDVDGDFLLIGKPHAGDLSQSRVGLLRRHRADLQADTPLLGAAVEHGRLGELPLGTAAAADELADRRHDSIQRRLGFGNRRE